MVSFITCNWYFSCVDFHALAFSLSDAAVVMLSGQIADGFTTIFAGELVCIDKVDK